MTGTGERVVALYLCVAAGSALGGGLRALVSMLLADPAGAAFPWATLAVNVVGSAVIGACASVTGPDGRWRAPTLQRQFVMTGFCGGLTTFSVFSLESLWLLQAGHGALAATNVAATVTLGLLAVWAGFALAARPGGGR